MLLLRCPHCGLRDAIEFRWGGDAGVERPGPGATDEAWHLYLYTRRNSKGLSAERWVHWAGCRQWFTVERDTLTHAVAGGSPYPPPTDHEGSQA